MGEVHISAYGHGLMSHKRLQGLAELVHCQARTRGFHPPGSHGLRFGQPLADYLSFSRLAALLRPAKAHGRALVLARFVPSM